MYKEERPLFTCILVDHVHVGDMIYETSEKIEVLHEHFEKQSDHTDRMKLFCASSVHNQETPCPQPYREWQMDFSNLSPNWREAITDFSPSLF